MLRLPALLTTLIALLALGCADEGDVSHQLTTDVAALQRGVATQVTASFDEDVLVLATPSDYFAISVTDMIGEGLDFSESTPLGSWRSEDPSDFNGVVESVEVVDARTVILTIAIPAEAVETSVDLYVAREESDPHSSYRHFGIATLDVTD